MSLKVDPSASSRFNLGLLWSRIRTTSGLNAAGVIDLKHDKDATAQAVGVLVLASLSLGIGYTIFTEIQSHDLSVYGIIVGGMANTITSCFASMIWSITVFIVGTKLFHGTTKYWELARPFFFSTAPALLFILISIPFRPIIVTVTVGVTLWLVISQTFVVKQVMGFNLRRTVLTLMVGFLILVFLGSEFSRF